MSEHGDTTDVRVEFSDFGTPTGVRIETDRHQASMESVWIPRKDLMAVRDHINEALSK